MNVLFNDALSSFIAFMLPIRNLEHPIIDFSILKDRTKIQIHLFIYCWL